MTFTEATQESDLWITEIKGKRYSQLIPFGHLNYEERERWYREEKGMRLEWELCHSLFLSHPNSSRTAVKKRYKDALSAFLQLCNEFTLRWGYDMAPLTVRINQNDAKDLLVGDDNWINEENVKQVLNSCWRPMLPSELNMVYRHEFGMDENENSASWYQHYWRTYVGEDDDEARGIVSSDDGGWLERRWELLSVWHMADDDFDPQAELDPAVILSFD